MLIHRQRECQTRLTREFADELQELEASREDIKKKGSQKFSEGKAAHRQLESLNSQEGQRLVELRRIKPEIAKAYEWLQENKSGFEKEVFGPPMLTCSVKDKRYFDLVQVALQFDDFFCFTAQTRNDHKKLTDEFFKILDVPAAVRTITADLSQFRPPVSQEGIKNLGLDGYALDFLEGPEPVLAMLCSEKKLHLTGVALQDVNEEQYQAIYDEEKIVSFATGKTYYRITRRREYGPGATSTMSKLIQKGKFWSDEPVDASAKTELEQRAKECQREVEELKQQLQEIKTKTTELQEKRKEVEEEKVRSLRPELKIVSILIKHLQERLEEEKRQLQREVSTWKALPDRIGMSMHHVRVRGPLLTWKQMSRRGTCSAPEKTSRNQNKYWRRSMTSTTKLPSRKPRLPSGTKSGSALCVMQTRLFLRPTSATLKLSQTLPP